MTAFQHLSTACGANARRFSLVLLIHDLATAAASAQTTGWYTEGNFAPSRRIKVTLLNTLDIARRNCPVVITRDGFPVKRLHEMSVTIP